MFWDFHPKIIIPFLLVTPPQASHSFRTLKGLKQQLGPHFCFWSCCCVLSISLLFQVFFKNTIVVSMPFIHTTVSSKLFICNMFVFFFVTLPSLCFSFVLLGPCFLFLLLLGPLFFLSFCCVCSIHSHTC
jgi:hypothetical protein